MKPSNDDYVNNSNNNKTCDNGFLKLKPVSNIGSYSYGGGNYIDI